MDTSPEARTNPENRTRRAPVEPSGRWQCGFTLIELMIVVALIAIVAGIAVPNLLASRVSANENVTVATLRTISSAQFQFKARTLIDRDASGSYEYGTLAELSGTAVVRQSTDRLSPPLLPASFGVIDAQGRISRQGYLFALFLPDAAGVGLAETAANLPNVDPRNAELAWTILAWPAVHGSTGRATFFINQQGTVLKSNDARYSGDDSPPPGAALLGAPDNIMGGALAIGVPGADGHTWRSAK